MSSVLRLTGLTTGMDTDKLVSDLMKIEQSKIDNVDKQKQLLEWEQEAYRDVIEKVQSFQSQYFDILNKDTNFRSATAFSEFSESITINGVDSSTYVDVTGTATIGSYSHTISSISRLATKDEWASDELDLVSIKSGSIDFGTAPASLEFSLTIDNATKTISISSGLGDQASLVSALNTEIASQFGADYNNVVKADGADGVSFSLDGNDLTILETTGHESELAWLGIDSGTSSNEYANKTLNELFSITDADLDAMTINGIALSSLDLTQDSKLADLTKAISNSSDVGADFVYNKATDTFSLIADKSGTANALTLSSEFQSFLEFDTGSATHEAAENAEIVLDGQTIIKASNTFTLDGIQYDLKETYSGADPIDIEVETDTTAIVDKIKDFVSAYNELIEDLDLLVSEQKDYDYVPLTEDEKDSMEDDAIEKWEKQAKIGILQSDTSISFMITKMRTAIYESVDGVDSIMYDIGITTSSNYKDHGKLKVDEEKLKEAIANDYETVVNLFTSESDKEYLDDDNATERYQENGIAYRLYDIIRDATRTTRDENGYKGILLEKAGMEDDASQEDNDLTKEIKKIQLRIDNMYDLYYDKEEQYYLQFANMETALAQLQQQSSALSSM